MSTFLSPWMQSKAPQLVLIFITIIWGGSFLTVQYGLNFSSPILFVALRFAAAAIAVSIISWRNLKGFNLKEIVAGACIGAVIAILLTAFGVPALAFSLGMFIPMELNVPLLVGGAIAWFVSTRLKDEKLNTARKERGTLLASGFIAGGALMGVVSAIIRFSGINIISQEWIESSPAISLALVMYIIIIAYLAWDSLRAKPENE